MNLCRILMKPLKKNELNSSYSKEGLFQLTGNKKFNPQLPFSRQDFITNKPKKQQGMSISGFQPKLQLIIENEQFKLKKEDYLPDENSQEYKIFDDFCAKSNEHLDDDGYIFYKLTDEKSATDLNGAIISEFQEDIGNYILLQNLILEDNQLKNQLISFNKNTGKIKVLADIKDFFWLDFDSETKTINGYNNKEQIEITISE